MRANESREPSGEKKNFVRCPDPWAEVWQPDKWQAVTKAKNTNTGLQTEKGRRGELLETDGKRKDEKKRSGGAKKGLAESHQQKSWINGGSLYPKKPVTCRSTRIERIGERLPYHVLHKVNPGIPKRTLEHPEPTLKGGGNTRGTLSSEEGVRKNHQYDLNQRRRMCLTIQCIGRGRARGIQFFRKTKSRGPYFNLGKSDEGRESEKGSCIAEEKGGVLEP